MGPDVETLRQICAACGCTLRRVRTLWDGTPALYVECHTHERKLQLLAMLADVDGRDPGVRRLAERIASGAHSPAETIASLHRWTCDHVLFTRELGEIFSPTLRTVETGLGDCDDSARVLYALLRSLGYRAGMATLGWPPAHVCCVVRQGGRWRWLETTVQAMTGEHPKAAAMRLGKGWRQDLG